MMYINITCVIRHNNNMLYIHIHLDSIVCFYNVTIKNKRNKKSLYKQWHF